MSKQNMKTTDEDVIIATSRECRKPFLSYLVIGICIAIGYFTLGKIGLIAGVLVGILLNMTFKSIRNVKLWKLCEKDYLHLISKGYSERNALLVISKSFNSGYSESFHEMVVDKFTTLDEIVFFYTGVILPENTPDEKWAIECLEKTIIEKHPSGTYKTRTKW